jgi:MFS family permease
VLLGRYAAADLGPEEDRARAMGLVLTTITVGAVIGPNLMSVATPLAPSGHGLAGSYVVAGLAFALSGVVLVAGSGPAGRQAVARTADADRSPSPAGPSARPGLAVLAVANLVMIAVMTVAPVQLHQHGAGLDLVGVVVGVHIASMFAPSSASAWLVGRIGAERVAAVSGLVLLAASVTAAARSTSTPGMVVAMAGLGLGWNLALVAGSTMITAGVPPADRPRREGRGELVMGVAAAAGGVGSGVLMGAAGYPTVALAGAALAVVPSLAAARRTRRPAFGPLPGPVGGPTTPAAVPEKGDGEFFGET